MFTNLDGFAAQTNASISSKLETDEVLETFSSQMSMENTCQDASMLIFDLEENQCLQDKFNDIALKKMEDIAYCKT